MVYAARVIAKTCYLEQLHEVRRLSCARQAVCVESDRASSHWSRVHRHSRWDWSLFQIVGFVADYWRHLVVGRGNQKWWVLLMRKVAGSASRQLKTFDWLVEIVFLVASDAQSFQIAFNVDCTEHALVLRDWVRIFWHLSDPISANKLNLVSILFILDREWMLNVTELNQTADDCCIVLHCFWCLWKTNLDLID